MQRQLVRAAHHHASAPERKENGETQDSRVNRDTPEPLDQTDQKVPSELQECTEQKATTVTSDRKGLAAIADFPVPQVIQDCPDSTDFPA